VSALLFILSIEMLGLLIRQHNDIRGFKFGFPEKPIKTVQYADDCILFLNNKNELCTSVSILQEFGKISGLELNLSKCEGLWLGRCKHKQKNCTLFGIKWPEQIRCLGIYVGHFIDSNIKMNWISRIEKTESIFENWKKRDLSLFGKIQVIKTFALSQFVLPATLLSVPPNIIKDIERSLYKFLWGSNDKVKRIKTIQELKNGGLNMVDIKTMFMSFKASWVTRILLSDPKVNGWSQIAYFYLQPFIDCQNNLIFNFDDTVYFPQLKSLSLFYKEVLLGCNRAFVTERNEFLRDISEQCLWGNKFIVNKQRKTNMILFLRNWIRSGVTHVRDLEFIDGKVNENLYLKILSTKRTLSLK